MSPPSRVPLGVRRHFSCLCLRLLGAALVGCGCTAVSDFDVRQCSSDADCELLQGPVQHCEQSRCVAGCVSNRQCAELDPRFPLCPSVGTECVELTNEAGACFVSSQYQYPTMGDRTVADVLLVGAFAPDVKTSAWLTLLLAAEEINQQGGLPTLGGASRPLLVVLCDDQPDSMEGAIHHLVVELGARAILADLDERALTLALSLPSGGGKALYLSPTGSVPALPQSDTERLWSLGAPASSLLAAYPALIGQALGSARATQPEGHFWRIAFLVSSAREDQALSQAVSDLLMLEGKSSAVLRGEDHVEFFSLSDDAPALRAQTLQEVVSYGPDVVALFAGGTFADADRKSRAAVLTELERLLGASSSLRPIYVLGPRNAWEAELQELALNDLSFRTRAVGLTADPTSDLSILAPLVARFGRHYPLLASGVSLAPNTYDALFYLAYALAAAPRSGAELTAEDVATGLSRITAPDEAEVEVGPGVDGLEKAVMFLQAGLPFDTLGTTGAVHFDQDHLRSGPVRAYCWDAAGELVTAANYDAVGGQFLPDAAGAERSAAGAGCAEIFHAAGN